MKKILLITSVLILLCVLLVSCNKLIDDENSKGAVQNEASLNELSVPLNVSDYNVSITEESDTSKIDVSVPEESSVSEEPPSEISETEESQTEVTEAYVWYGQKELDQWYANYKAEIEARTGNKRTADGKHVRYYNSNSGEVIRYINLKAGTNEHYGIFDTEYRAMFGCTEDIATPAMLDYYGITKEEYIEYYNSLLPAVPEGEIPLVDLMGYRYEALFSEQYWNHPDFLLSDYVPPEIDSYYTSLEDRGGYTKRYYRIDRLLIEYVGVDEFEKWLEEKEDVDQNILDFVKYFGITREIYEDIYRDTCLTGPPEYVVVRWLRLPYNTDYLFGTPEMQDEYFKVHPLD